MKALASTLMALMLAFGIAAPALAGGGQQQRVTKTFQLTLQGNVPADYQFGVAYFAGNVSPQAGNPSIVGVQFCGPVIHGPVPVKVTVSTGACRGNGTVYTYKARFPTGTRLYFTYSASKSDDPKFVDFFYSSDPQHPNDPKVAEVLNGDTTNAGWYRFAEQPTQLPHTGVGGAQTRNLPTELALALIVVVGVTGLRTIKIFSGR